jgi:hypothetical protein
MEERYRFVDVCARRIIVQLLALNQAGSLLPAVAVFESARSPRDNGPGRDKWQHVT